MKKDKQQELLKLVEKNYEQICDHFHETRKKHIWPELTKIAKELKGNDKILDVGCGNGRLLETLKDKKIKYLGVDNSEGLLQKADQTYQNKNIEFRKANILELYKIKEIDFDFVFCVAALHHIPGKKLRLQALKQMKNKIRKGGKIILVNWNIWKDKKKKSLIYKFGLLKIIGKNKMDFGDILFDWKNPQGEIKAKRYYHAFRSSELKKLSRQAGLSFVSNYKDDKNYYTILTK